MELIWFPLIKCGLILALLWLTWRQFKKGNMQGVLAFTTLAVVAAVYSPVKLTETSYQHIESTFKKEPAPLPERITVERKDFKDSVEEDLREYEKKREEGEINE